MPGDAPHLSKCIEFTDISYQLAQADTKTAIFENLCDLYNYLDASIHVQFSFINRKIDPKQYAKSFEIRAQGDDFDDIRSEYSDILQDQLVNGNNGLMKRKFMTYTIEADSLKMARARLRRIETDLLGYFKSMGASAWGLDAKERLEVMHSISTRTGNRSPLTGSGLPRRAFYQGLYRPVLVPLRQCPDVRAGRQIRGGELSANPLPGTVG